MRRHRVAGGCSAEYEDVTGGIVWGIKAGYCAAGAREMDVCHKLSLFAYKQRFS